MTSLQRWVIGSCVVIVALGLVVSLASGGIQAAGQPGQRGPGGRGFIQDFDRDGDGRVSAAEFPGPKQHFTRLDRNKDGFIDESEKPKSPPPCDPLQGFDGNGDGKLSRAEFPGPDDHFAMFDKNKDGFLERSELPQGPPPGQRQGSGRSGSQGRGRIKVGPSYKSN